MNIIWNLDLINYEKHLFIVPNKKNDTKNVFISILVEFSVDLCLF